MKSKVLVAHPVWVAAAFAFLSFEDARAQAPSFELDPVTVTGSGRPRTLGSEIAATSVLTRGDIERAGARDAVQVLQLLGTVQVEQQGGPGTLASLRIRGADSRDTLVLVDGVPLTDVTSGQALIQQIPADIIERVEAVRGNLSALYGANATGGVIQIFTRRGAAGAPRATLAAGLGSHDTRSLSASVAAGSDVLNARLAVGTERTDGFSAADPAIAPQANPDRDGNKRQHATLAVDAQPTAGHRIGLDLRHVDGTVQYDSTSSFSSPSDTHEQHLVQLGAALHGQHVLLPDWTFGWRWGGSDERRTDRGTTAFGPFEFGNKVHNRVAALDLDGKPAPGWRVQLGIERLAQSTDIPTYTRNSRDTDVLRAGGTYDAEWGSLQANARHDRTTDFGSATTGLLGARLKLGGGLSGIANVATSFTPPTLDFLFFDCSPFGVCSNPDLRPEKARNVEAGLQWQDTRTLLRATLFTVHYTDKIVTDANFFPRNVGSAKNKGLELAVRTALDAWRLMGEATFQDPVDETTGSTLQRRPRQQLALRADHETGPWSAGAGVRYVGHRPDRLNGVDVRLPGYAVVDASARWLVATGWSLRATLENVFDRHYQPTAGYNGRPRGVFVTAEWQPSLR
jgi:vitamin B12 transporter